MASTRKVTGIRRKAKMAKHKKNRSRKARASMRKLAAEGATIL